MAYQIGKDIKVFFEDGTECQACDIAIHMPLGDLIAADVTYNVLDESGAVLRNKDGTRIIRRRESFFVKSIRIDNTYGFDRTIFLGDRFIVKAYTQDEDYQNKRKYGLACEFPEYCKKGGSHFAQWLDEIDFNNGWGVYNTVNFSRLHGRAW